MPNADALRLQGPSQLSTVSFWANAGTPVLLEAQYRPPAERGEAPAALAPGPVHANRRYVKLALIGLLAALALASPAQAEV